MGIFRRLFRADKEEGWVLTPYYLTPDEVVVYPSIESALAALGRMTGHEHVEVVASKSEQGAMVVLDVSKQPIATISKTGG